MHEHALLVWCELVSKYGSGALSMTELSDCGDEASAQEVELGASEHLPLDQLELGDLTFGITAPSS